MVRAIVIAVLGTRGKQESGSTGLIDEESRFLFVHWNTEWDGRFVLRSID
jgi:hypothetical protein